MSAKRHRQQRFALLFPIVCFLFSVGIPWLPLSLKASVIANGVLAVFLGICIVGWVYYIRLSWAIVKHQRRRDLVAVIFYHLMIAALLVSAFGQIRDHREMISIHREAESG